MKSPIHLPPFVQKESSWPGWNFPEQYSVIGSRHIRPAKLLNESAIAQRFSYWYFEEELAKAQIRGVKQAWIG